MLNFTRFILFSLLISLFSLQAEEISIEERVLIEKISETKEALNNKEEIVWKSYNLSKTPLIITFSNGHIYAFGLNSQNPLWQPKSVAGNKILFSDQDHWDLSKVSMQDQFILDGEECFVFHMDEKEKQSFEKPVLVLIHELFHRYQFENFKKELDDADYVDQLNIDNLSLIQLEEHLLIEFLKAKKEDKLDCLKNYMAVHLTRKTFINPSSFNWERSQQVMEGLADYVSLKTFDSFKISEQFNLENHLIYVLEGYIFSPDPQELAIKWSHYGIGATLGFALDFLNVADWKKQIEEAQESQGSLLEKAIPMSSKEIKERLKKVKKTYHFDKIKKEIKEKVENFGSMVEALLKDYEKQEGIVVTIEKPYDVAVNGGGKNYGIFHLEEHTSLFVKDTSFSSSSDNLWKIEFKEIPYVLQNGYSSRIFKINPDLIIFLDERPYKIEELKEKRDLSFTSISWNDKTSHFESKEREGKLFFNEEGLFLIFRFF